MAMGHGMQGCAEDDGCDLLLISMGYAPASDEMPVWIVFARAGKATCIGTAVGGKRIRQTLEADHRPRRPWVLC